MESHFVQRTGLISGSSKWGNTFTCSRTLHSCLKAAGLSVGRAVLSVDGARDNKPAALIDSDPTREVWGRCLLAHNVESIDIWGPCTP